MSRGIVSVFGASSPMPESEAYREAQELGELLGKAGYTVATGGYVGTMEAVSRGASEAGAHVIGVTSSIFDGMGSGRQGPNQWVSEELKLPTLRERLYHLVSFCDAAVALRGGIGTLTEVMLTWNLLQTGELPARPFVLLGRDWEDMLTAFFGWGDYIRPEYMHIWQCVGTPQEAVDALDGRM